MFHRYSILLVSITLSLAFSIEAKAQLVPDNTLGKENSIVTPTNLLQKIDGGAIRGSNLFHSFKEFNIDSSKSVYFSNPSAIQNILTRVTGKNQSNIFGKLGVLGNANLFLLNPNGIVFGKDASLDISGSFSATTSPSILFDNGFEFSATNPQAPPLLKVNITPGLQYPRSQQGDIKNQANLTVGKDLNLIGKNLNLTGELNSGGDLNLKASDTLQIRDNSDNPFIASADGDLLLQANQTIDIFALNHSDSGLFSGNDLVLQSSNPVLGDARYFSGGSFRIEQLDGSLGNLESPKDPIIRASGDVSFDSYDGASLHILAGGKVNITGDVTITGADGENGLQETVTLSNGESLQIDGKEKATLDIRAGTTAFGIEGVTGSGVENLDTGGSASSSDIVIDGDIRVNTADGLVFLSNQYSADSSLSGGNIEIKGSIVTSNGDGGGQILIDSKGDIETQSLDSSSFSEERSGNGGDITLTAGGDITTSEQIDSFSFSGEGNSGNGGAIALTAGGDITTSDWLDSASVSDGGSSGDEKHIVENRGNGGTILLKANNDISVETISTSSNKKSGDIDIKTKAGSFFLNNSFISTNPIKDGNAGNINIEAPSIFLTQSDISSSASGEGNSGNITLNSAGDINLDNSRLFTTMEPGATGEGGNIKISTQKLQLENYSLIDTGTYSSGDAGNVDIKAQEISLNNNSSILSLTSGTGKAGNINLDVSGKVALNFNSNISTASTLKSTGNSGNISIKSNELWLTEGSQLQALTEGKGNSGNIDINVIDIVNIGGFSADENISGIFTSSKGKNSGEGGNLTINSRNLKVTNGGVLNAQNSSNISKGGNITINADTVSLENGGQLLADTNGEGKAGEVTINATKYINILGVDSEFENRPEATTSSEQNVPGKISSCSESGECQKLPEPQGKFSTDSNDDIDNDDNNVEFSTRIPYVSVEGKGDDSVDYYAVEIKQSGTRAVFDIDLDIDFEGPDIDPEDSDQEIDTKLTIFDSNNKKLADNDNSSVALGGSGSASKEDPYIRYTFNQAGTYKIKVSSADGGGIPKGQKYALQISLESPPITGITANAEAASGIFASSEKTGEAGTIKINTPELNIADGAQVTVSSKLGQAGNLNITADNLFLNQGKLTAETNARGDSEGANITLNIKDLLRMENNSLISAKASGSANGGNITIENSKGFIIGLPFEDSDINANASEGKGGNIKINTQNIFGLVFRDQNTDKSDITVSSKSGLRGEVTVNQLNVNPASGLVELPSTLVETTGIKAGCAASAGNTFIVSPKGGLPQSPDDLFHGNATHTDLFDLIPTRDIASDINNQNYPNYRNSTSSVDNKDQNQNQIVEATGWVVDANGDVLFVAKMPQDSQNSSDINSVSCEDFSS